MTGERDVGRRLRRRARAATAWCRALGLFSRAGENYFNGGRKELTVGNTAVVARIIRDALHCDVEAARRDVGDFLTFVVGPTKTIRRSSARVISGSVPRRLEGGGRSRVSRTAIREGS